MDKKALLDPWHTPATERQKEQMKAEARECLDNALIKALGGANRGHNPPSGRGLAR